MTLNATVTIVVDARSCAGAVKVNKGHKTREPKTLKRFFLLS
jgi:hypothetical protein